MFESVRVFTIVLCISPQLGSSSLLNWFVSVLEPNAVFSIGVLAFVMHCLCYCHLFASNGERKSVMTSQLVCTCHLIFLIWFQKNMT